MEINTGEIQLSYAPGCKTTFLFIFVFCKQENFSHPWTGPSSCSSWSLLHKKRVEEISFFIGIILHTGIIYIVCTNIYSCFLPEKKLLCHQASRSWWPDSHCVLGKESAPGQSYSWGRLSLWTDRNYWRDWLRTRMLPESK